MKTSINKRKQVPKVTLQYLVKKICFLIFAAGLAVGLAPALSRAADDVPRMTIQELKARMDRGEKIIILDVRSGADYASSKIKISGAVRIPLDQLNVRYKELSEGNEIIIYCA
jgi:hypothetical protein